MAKSMADVLREQGIEQGIEQGKAEGIEQGIEQGKAEGIEQGKAKGIEQGKTRAKQEAVIKLLQFRFNDIPKMVTDQVTSIQDLSRLDLLFEEVWEADTLDEINLQNLVSEDS